MTLLGLVAVCMGLAAVATARFTPQWPAAAIAVGLRRLRRDGDRLERRVPRADRAPRPARQGRRRDGRLPRLHLRRRALRTAGVHLPRRRRRDLCLGLRDASPCRPWPAASGCCGATGIAASPGAPRPPPWGAHEGSRAARGRRARAPAQPAAARRRARRGPRLRRRADGAPARRGGLAASVAALEVDAIQHAKNLAGPRPAGLEFVLAGADAIPFPDARLRHRDDVQVAAPRAGGPARRGARRDPPRAGPRRLALRLGARLRRRRSTRSCASSTTRRRCAPPRSPRCAARRRPAFFEEVEERHFDVPLAFRDFDDFLERIVKVTHSDHLARGRHARARCAAASRRTWSPAAPASCVRCA